MTQTLTYEAPAATARRPATHHFTVDVEEYFQVSAFEGVVPRGRWEEFPSRVGRSVNQILALLDSNGARGTFFVLGWVAERHPQIVRSIAAAGHEVASHGWDHRRVTTLTPAEFRASVSASKRLLEDLTGQSVDGFRAPSFSIVPGFEWALDVLLEEGYRYDSSLFPVRRRGYGYPSAQRTPHWIRRENGSIAEFPLTTLAPFGMNLPSAGGAYFRVLPYALTSAALRRFESAGVPGTFYIHPWEIDAEQPRLQVPASTRLRHYTGLRSTRERIRRLLSEFRFTTTMRETLEDM
jgi:polysaccharide deacetylase family protein (PEP-CTERM system associated)